MFVPRSVGRINKFMTMLPRGGRETIGRFLGADKVLAEADMAARAAYEQRVAHSEPTPLETADKEEQPVA